MVLSAALFFSCSLSSSHEEYVNCQPTTILNSSLWTMTMIFHLFSLFNGVYKTKWFLIKTYSTWSHYWLRFHHKNMTMKDLHSHCLSFNDNAMNVAISKTSLPFDINNKNVFEKAIKSKLPRPLNNINANNFSCKSFILLKCFHSCWKLLFVFIENLLCKRQTIACLLTFLVKFCRMFKLFSYFSAYEDLRNMKSETSHGLKNLCIAISLKLFVVVAVVAGTSVEKENVHERQRTETFIFIRARFIKLTSVCYCCRVFAQQMIFTMHAF